MSGAEGAALSGLKAGSQAMISISNNMSNAETTGYKHERATFSTVLAGTASNQTFSSGGVRAKPVRSIDEQGLLLPTSNATDIAVSGNGFFVVADEAAGALKTYSFTRAGEFYPDKNGDLRSATNGKYLQGWATDQAGVPTALVTNVLASTESINVNKVNNVARATSNIDLAINLPVDTAVAGTQTTNLRIYDSLGAPQDLVMTWTRAVADPITWTLTIASVNATSIEEAAATPYSIDVVFDGSGQPVTFDGAATPPDISIVWAGPALDQSITLDLGTPNTSDGITSRSGAYEEYRLNQDGKELGKFSDVTISEDGFVTVIYTNGETLITHQIPLANFPSSVNLGAKDGNVFTQTDESGGYLLSAARTNGLGSIFGSSLEESTVDMAENLTRLMRMSRFYSGNTKVIQTNEEIFTELKNVKR